MKTARRLQGMVQLLLVLGIVFLVNLVSSFFYTQLDITEDKRFTLSGAGYRLLDQLDDVLMIDVYLEGDFPSEYKRLRNAVSDMLYRLQDHQKLLEYRFYNPLPPGTSDAKKDTIEQQLRIKSFPVSDGRQGSPIYYVYPAATLRYKTREQTIYFLEANDLTQNLQTGTLQIRDLNAIINQLEYKFVYAIKKLLERDRPRLAILSGHGEPEMFVGFDPRGRRMPNPTTYAFQQALFRHYDYEPINLDSTYGIDPNIDLLIISKPRKQFGMKHLFMVDQYVMSGGKVLWLVEGTDIETDSLRGDGIHLLKDLPLDVNSLLFKYGARVNNNIIASWESSALPGLQTGGMGVQTAQKWFYYPLAYPHLTPQEAKEQGTSLSNHPIVKDLDYVEMRYASSIDTVRTATDVRKTPLLRTAKNSKLQYPPTVISFGTIDPTITADAFQKGHQTTAMLLEGTFESYFKNKVPPEMIAAWEAQGQKIEFVSKKPTKMVVISDGDLVLNEFNKTRGMPSPLGMGFHPQFGGYLFGNEAFLMNCIEYMLDENNIMEARTKEIKLRPLDRERYFNEETWWKLVNLGLPLLLLGLLGWGYNGWRRKRFAR